MKQQVHPAVIVVVVIVLVAGLGFWFTHAMQPAPYKPSPGAGGTPNTGVPVYAKAPGQPGSSDVGTAPTRSPVVPPSGSRAGDPHSISH
jgi:hypothetical protein